MLLKTFNLKQVIDFPTRIGSSSVLLIVFFYKSRIGSFHLFPAMNGLSDFNGRILILENFQVSTQNNVHKYELRQINEDTIQNFQLALENENWEEIHKQDNINSKFNAFNIFLIKYENSFAVTQRRYVNNGNKWITTGIGIS
jgi:hypothetical protein